MVRRCRRHTGENPLSGVSACAPPERKLFEIETVGLQRGSDDRNAESSGGRSGESPESTNAASVPNAAPTRSFPAHTLMVRHPIVLVRLEIRVVATRNTFFAARLRVERISQRGGAIYPGPLELPQAECRLQLSFAARHAASTGRDASDPTCTYLHARPIARLRGGRDDERDRTNAKTTRRTIHAPFRRPAKADPTSSGR